MAWMENFSSEGGTLLFVSHSPEQIRRLCGKAVYLQKGRVIALDSAKAICDLYEKDLYGSASKLAKVAPNRKKIANHKEHGDEIPIFPFVECAIKYGNGQAEIFSVWTEGLDGLRKSSFIVGEQFFWVCAILFKVDICSAFFGMQVKTKEGITLYSVNTASLDKRSSFMAGDTITIRFEVNSHLGSGEYFLNCGIGVESGGNLTFIARVVDAAIISFSTSEKTSMGLIDMETHFSYESRCTNESH
jgi:lipopolysaccharide transport system ATP-binding protein